MRRPTMFMLSILVLAMTAACETRPAEQKAEPGAQPAARPGATPAAVPTPTPGNETAPAVYKVRFETTKGDVLLEIHRDWAPNGADRFYNLVKGGYFTDVAIFRVIKGFMAQFGIHGDPSVSARWREERIPDDPTGKQSNLRGTITFATSGPNSRTTQLFINYKDNVNLDQMGFTPIGKVVTGMEIVDAWNGEYGEGAPRGRGPDQGRAQSQGNAYFKAEFPNLDYIKRAEVLP